MDVVEVSHSFKCIICFASLHVYILYLVFMIFMSTLGFGVVQLLNDSSGKMDNAKERVNWALVGALGHAMGHIILVTSKRYGLLPSGEVSALDEFLADDCTIGTYAKHIPGYILFWIPLVKTYMYNVSRNHVAVFAFLFLIGGFPIPLKYGFSYTLTVLFIGQSLDQLFLPKQRKGFEYMLWPVVTLLPNFCLYVLESQLCTESALFKKHGHIIFDGYMGLSYSVYYLICWRWNSNKVKSEKKL